ncbi:hypothetical protein [Guptibacillus algicola]|uniref:hypothetical protein n=1 Tax=Guptibacillus algicola TaxID=225844 RepID=UPI001CD5CB69|nr:hypothetical protein [Alkalihalobacillus algicola]MCA0988509.1 hypothetical protein [Alkalihalobacillus algicola]
MEVYDQSFNQNEWFVIISIFVLFTLLFVLPKLFSLLETIGYCLFGLFIGMFSDQTLSIAPWDFYDVNDTAAYQVTDFLSYLMYCPYSYFFVYFYVRLNIKGPYTILYIVIWTAASLLMEWIGTKIGLYHFNKGYSMYWSVPIYLFFQSILVIYFEVTKRT